MRLFSVGGDDAALSSQTVYVHDEGPFQSGGVNNPINTQTTCEKIVFTLLSLTLKTPIAEPPLPLHSTTEVVPAALVSSSRHRCQSAAAVVALLRQGNDVMTATMTSEDGE